MTETQRIVGYLTAANGWHGIEPGWYRADADHTSYSDDEFADVEFVLNNEDTEGPFKTREEAIGAPTPERSEIPQRTYPIEGRAMSPELRNAFALVADELKRTMIGNAVPKRQVRFTVEFTADLGTLPTSVIGVVVREARDL